MAKRMILMLAVMAALLAGLGFVKFRQIHAAGQNASFQPPPEAVTTTVAQRETWPSTLNVIGTAMAIQGVTVSAVGDACAIACESVEVQGRAPGGAAHSP